MVGAVCQNANPYYEWKLTLLKGFFYLRSLIKLSK